jgi:hypothetical protein
MFFDLAERCCEVVASLRVWLSLTALSKETGSSQLSVA